MNNNAGGVIIILLFLLIGLVVMGCYLIYWNWSHRKEQSADDSENISNGNACIYEKTNQRPYNRSSKWISTIHTQYNFCYSILNQSVLLI